MSKTTTVETSWEWWLPSGDYSSLRHPLNATFQESCLRLRLAFRLPVLFLLRPKHSGPTLSGFPDMTTHSLIAQPPTAVQYSSEDGQLAVSFWLILQADLSAVTNVWDVDGLSDEPLARFLPSPLITRPKLCSNGKIGMTCTLVP